MFDASNGGNVSYVPDQSPADGGNTDTAIPTQASGKDYGPTVTVLGKVTMRAGRHVTNWASTHPRRMRTGGARSVSRGRIF